jgi:hypothetical protein
VWFFGGKSRRVEFIFFFLSHTHLTATPANSPIARIQKGNAFYLDARVAQLVEHLHGKQRVTGSIPVVGSLERRAGASPIHNHLCLRRALSSRLLVFEGTPSSIALGFVK